jgi:4'-phosphopantetheinyl transferase
MTDHTWNNPPTNWQPTANRIDVWRTTIDHDTTALDHCYANLITSDERKRADQFRISNRRNEFILGRAMVRHVLGKSLACDPITVTLTFEAKGKPFLEPAVDVNCVEFNLSHSHGLLLLAVTQTNPIGVDVEKMRVKTDCTKLATRYFSKNEVAALNQVPAKNQREAFFNCWTRKEAFLKATGKGISFGLDQFDVAFWPTADARLLATRFDESEAANWAMANIPIDSGYAASVCIKADSQADNSLDIARWAWQCNALS